MTSRLTSSGMDSGQPKTPVLNLDILLVVIEFCDRRTKSRLSRAWKILHERAARYLLDGKVEIHSHERLNSLYRFLSVDGYHRIRFLRDLEVWGTYTENPPASFGRQLISILQHSSHLEALSLVHAEDLVEVCPGTSFEDALSRLATLRRLRIHGAGLSVRDMVADLELPLVAMDLEYSQRDPRPEPPPTALVGPWEERLDVDEIPDWHPALICARLAPTLEEFKARLINPEQYRVLWADLDLRVYTNLHTLVLEDDWPFARPWIISCPHLKNLSVTSLRWEEGICQEEEEGDWDEHRENSVNDQRANGSWTALEEYSGYKILLLYLFGLTCRIPRLVIRESLDEEGLMMLRAILPEAKPTHLVASVGKVARFLGEPDGEVGIATLFCEDGAVSYIETLELTLDVYDQYVLKVDHRQAVRDLFDALSLLPRLTRLELTLILWSQDEDELESTISSESSGTDTAPDAEDAVDVNAPATFIKETDPDRLARRAMRILTTVKFVEVVRWGRGLEHLAARLSKDEGGELVVPDGDSEAADLSSDEGSLDES
ncbi:hypothetical protein OH77DRAFT_1516724 [Trametes cingulata]|nr:hypothetical protein OH77DRAFT_1516724 [Trametes cingulata]